MVTSFAFLFTGVGVGNMHTALGNKLKEMKSKTLDGWNFNQEQLLFIEAILKDDLIHQITKRRIQVRSATLSRLS